MSWIVCAKNCYIGISRLRLHLVSFLKYVACGGSEAAPRGGSCSMIAAPRRPRDGFCGAAATDFHVRFSAKFLTRSGIALGRKVCWSTQATRMRAVASKQLAVPFATVAPGRCTDVRTALAALAPSSTSTRQACWTNSTEARPSLSTTTDSFSSLSNFAGE